MERTPEDYANKDYDDLWQENENKCEAELSHDKLGDLVIEYIKNKEEE